MQSSETRLSRELCSIAPSSDSKWRIEIESPLFSDKWSTIKNVCKQIFTHPHAWTLKNGTHAQRWSTSPGHTSTWTHAHADCAVSCNDLHPAWKILQAAIVPCVEWGLSDAVYKIHPGIFYFLYFLWKVVLSSTWPHSPVILVTLSVLLGLRTATIAILVQPWVLFQHDSCFRYATFPQRFLPNITLLHTESDSYSDSKNSCNLCPLEQNLPLLLWSCVSSFLWWLR